MPLEVEVHNRGYELSEVEEERFRRQVASLEKRLARFPSPRMEVALDSHQGQRRYTVDVRLALGPNGEHLVSHQGAETMDLAVKLATDDIKRQLERHMASMRREDTYGVPSRREPAGMRPNPLNGDGEAGELEDELEAELEEEEV